MLKEKRKRKEGKSKTKAVGLKTKSIGQNTIHPTFMKNINLGKFVLGMYNV